MRKLLVLGLALAAGAAAIAGERASRSPGPPPPAVASGRTATAVFAGGCFWSMETDFDHVPGILSTTSGYSGGHVANPTYEQVSARTTGHLESVRVVYDPRRISYAALVDRFLHLIDPLDDGGQFCDRGGEYRTAIFAANAGERRVAEAMKARASRTLRRPVATRALARSTFYPAEDYHQDYARKNPVRYRLYRVGCGRDARVREVWSRAG